MKLNELLKDIEILESTISPETEAADVRYDSRGVEEGDLFVAIRGFESDGHRFIAAAAERGACAVICEERPGTDIPYVLVEDSRYALAIISRNYFGDPAGRMKIVGVTGTNGKTTTTMLLKHVLEDRGYKCGLIGTNQNMIGGEVLPTERTTPESYELQKLFCEMADNGCQYVIMEVSSHSLVLHRVAGIRFAAAAFTNLTQDHLDFHNTMEAYAGAKALLLKNCDKAAVNLDDEWGGYMCSAAGCPVMTFSESRLEADLVAKEIKLLPDGVRFLALNGDSLERVALGIPGRFSVYNAMTVIALCLLLGLDLKKTAESLATAKGVKGRVEVVPTGEDYTILIDYAHTPDALENVILSMKEVAAGRVVVLFGCGGDRDKTKRPVMGDIGVRLADFAVITSDNPRTEEPGQIISEILEGVKSPKNRYTVIEDRKAAIEWVMDHHQKNDLVILAGKGHETYQIIGRTKHPMDEREIVAEHLRERKK